MSVAIAGAQEPNEPPYHFRLFSLYLEAVQQMQEAAQDAPPDWIAAQAYIIVYFGQQLKKAGYKPVWYGSWWNLDSL